MSWPKVFDKIFERLDSIEAKLDRISPSAKSSDKQAEIPETEHLSFFPDYEDSTVSDTLRRVKSMSPSEKEQLLEYEKEHKNRSLIVEALSKK